MKKIILGISLLLLFANPAIAKNKTFFADTLEKVIERHLVAPEQTKNVKTYYTNQTTADICESWTSCAKWALKQYSQDKTFKIVKAELKTQRKVHRHLVTKETHLFVDAIYTGRTVRVEFITPQANRWQQSYNYVVPYPQK